MKLKKNVLLLFQLLPSLYQLILEMVNIWCLTMILQALIPSHSVKLGLDQKHSRAKNNKMTFIANADLLRSIWERTIGTIFLMPSLLIHLNHLELRTAIACSTSWTLLVFGKPLQDGTTQLTLLKLIPSLDSEMAMIPKR